ncbi:CXADR-like membrane protein [Archocentrus centrarchus]|uniref:CXADR-like membrane protein n=1 Tax=Archocentrus centrarchus TaxID=63155 RepID=UPI0011EA1C89|nr:CXADR-like membrane protein [Archocentrus centrarchus]
MAAETASLCWILLFQVFVFVCADQETLITAETGQDVPLTCRAPNKNNKNKIVVVKWSRTDLENEHVLMYRNGQFVTAKQHPSFKNRVDLQDRQMKDGDASLILKDVTTDDEGTYDCSVFMEGAHSWELISIIYLRVDPPDQAEGDTEAAGKEDGSVGLKVGLLVPLVVLAVVGFAIYKRKQQDPKISEDQTPLQSLQDPEEYCMKTKQI